MISKKNMLLLFVSLVVICLTVSAVSAAEDDATAVADTQPTEIQKMVDSEQTDTVQTEKTSNKINKTTKENVKTAATYYVATNGKSSNTGTSSSPYDLDTAISKVVSDKGGNLVLNGGTYKLTSQIKLNAAGSYTLTGQSGKTVTLNGQQKSRILYTGSNVNLDVKNIVFTNGKENNIGGAIFQDYNGKLTVSNCTFTNNAGTYGGAIFARGTSLQVSKTNFVKNEVTSSGGAINNAGSTAKITDSVFTENKASYYGGAVYSSAGTTTVTSDKFTKNSAQNGGAIYDSVNNLVVSKGTFTQNTATNGAGAVYAQGTGLKITDSTFTQNSAPDAGAILNIKTTNAVIQNNKFTSNTASTGGGGAITNNNAKGTDISKNTFEKNKATKGDGAAVIIYETCSNIAVKNNDFTSNSAGRTAGAIFTAGVSTVVSSNVMTKNTAQRTGGALYDEGKSLTVSDNTVTYNNVTNDGAGLYIRGTNAVISKNKVNYNIANRLCGGVYIDGDNATVQNNYIQNNRAAQAGAGIYIDDNTNAIVKSNVIKNNVAGTTGGAIANNAARNTQIVYNTISNNVAKSGGAIANNAATNVAIARNTFTSNSAKQNGGAIINYGGSKINMNLNEFYTNEAASSGGAVYGNPANSYITNSNFTQNKAKSGMGGAIFDRGSKSIIKGNIFTLNKANATGAAIRSYGTGASISNNANSGTTKAPATIYTDGASVTINSNSFKDTMPAPSATTTKVNSVSGTWGNTITLKATVSAANGKTINDGTVTFKINGKTLKTDNTISSSAADRKVNVVNGVATYQFTAPSELTVAQNLTASYSGSTYFRASSTATKSSIKIAKRNLKVQLNVTPTYVNHYQTVKFTAKLVDASKGTVAQANSNAYVIFKINDKTLKNSKGETIKCVVKNGVASFTYTIPKATAAFNGDGSKQLSYKVTAIASHPKYNAANATGYYKVRRSNVTFNTSKVLVNGTSNRLVIKGNIKDSKGNNIVGTYNVSVKINGKTFKTASVKNGVINFSMRLTDGLNVKNITLAIGKSPAYNGRQTTITNFQVIKSNQSF